MALKYLVDTNVYLAFFLKEPNASRAKAFLTPRFGVIHHINALVVTEFSSSIS